MWVKLSCHIFTKLLLTQLEVVAHTRAVTHTHTHMSKSCGAVSILLRLISWGIKKKNSRMELLPESSSARLQNCIQSLLQSVTLTQFPGCYTLTVGALWPHHTNGDFITEMELRWGKEVLQWEMRRWEEGKIGMWGLHRQGIWWYALAWLADLHTHKQINSHTTWLYLKRWST